MLQRLYAFNSYLHAENKKKKQKITILIRSSSNLLSSAQPKNTTYLNAIVLETLPKVINTRILQIRNQNHVRGRIQHEHRQRQHRTNFVHLFLFGTCNPRANRLFRKYAIFARIFLVLLRVPLTRFREIDQFSHSALQQRLPLLTRTVVRTVFMRDEGTKRV